MPVGLVLLRLSFVEGDDIALGICAFANAHFLDPELGVSCLPLEDQRHHRGGIIEHDIADDAAGALARTQDVFHTQLFKGSDGIGADHAAIGHDARAGDAKAGTQARDDGHQHFHVGRVARHHLGADRAPLRVDHHGQDHLGKLGPMILGMTTPTQRIVACAIERERGGIHEDKAEVGEQVPAAIEQLLLDYVLHAAGHQCALRLLLNLLAQPGHGTIEVMEGKILAAIHGIAFHPVQAGAVRA